MPRTLAVRVAVTTTVAVAIAGLVVALVTTILADRIDRTRERGRLFDAAGTLALELSEPGVDPVWIAADETRELAHTGMRVAIDAGAQRIAGDPTVPSARAGACTVAHDLRACGVAAGQWTAIVGDSVDLGREHRRSLMVAATFAVVITTILGASFAVVLSRRVLAPLSRLRLAVERVDPERPVRADLGRSEGVVEIDALREALRTALTRLDVSLTQSRRFARNAAHELRTPLTTMLGELDLATERLSVDEREPLLRVRRVGERLTMLVERLLILAHVDAAPELAEDVMLLDLVEEVSEIVPASQWERVRVRVENVATRGDRVLLLALLVNALENALKFSSDRVDLDISRVDRTILVTVRDRGPGIPEAQRNEVFAPFYRSPAARAAGVPGHGLGLALIRHVAALHGGTARFAPTTCGARLEIVLPGA